MAELTSREREIALLAGGGMPNKEIARELCISGWTVKNHLTAAYRKLPPHRGKFKRMVLVAYARRQAQADPPDAD